MKRKFTPFPIPRIQITREGVFHRKQRIREQQRVSRKLLEMDRKLDIIWAGWTVEAVEEAELIVGGRL